MTDLTIPPLEEIGTPIIAPIEDGPPDVIPGLLPKRGQLVIAGPTDVGKSLIALEICSALSTGTKLWGELNPTIVARKILYVLGEHYNEVIQRLWAVTKLPMTEHVYLVGPDKMGYDKWLVAKGAPNPQAIDKMKRWADGCDLVVFDPFSAFVSGVDAENDNVQMRLALDQMSLVAQTAGASCIVLAHMGKPSMNPMTGKESNRKSYAIRGASAIEDAATNIFYMSRIEGEDDEGRMLPAGQKAFELRNRKYKGIAPPKYTLLRDDINLTHSALGNRPYHEVMQLDTVAKVTRLQNAMPQLSMKEAIQAVAAMTGKTEETIQRWIKSA